MNEVENKLIGLMKKVPFRDKQLVLLYRLLISNPNLSYPLIHLYGLSGTGKTYTIQKFMKKYCGSGGSENEDDRRRFYVYLNCNELCYANKSLLFHEILEQVRASLSMRGETSVMDAVNDEVDICYNQIDELAELARESEAADGEREQQNQMWNDDDDDADAVKGTINDCSSFLRQLRAVLNSNFQQTSLYLIFDNADRLKYLGNDTSSVLLTLCKLNEYLNPEIGRDSNDFAVRASCVFISEIDWHGLTSEWDIMSKTDAPRPYPVFFSDYTRDEMSAILAKTASNFLELTDRKEKNKKSQHAENIKFYSRIILEVFYPICKDLNEIQYLIQIYYDQLLSSAAAAASSNDDGNEAVTSDKLLGAWNKMKPFLKQALTQIYLRQSMYKPVKTVGSGEENNLTKELESLSLSEPKKPGSSNDQSCNQLPRLMKFILISAYIATHNPTKYDRKLFELGKTGGGRKSRFTAQRFQQLEDNQHAAALKSHSFDLNRLMAIFFAICNENLATSSAINLSQIMLNVRTLKSLHYLQQSNSTYSSLDEPKFKCLVDFDTILGLSSSVQINIKQYLAEYINL